MYQNETVGVQFDSFVPRTGKQLHFVYYDGLSVLATIQVAKVGANDS